MTTTEDRDARIAMLMDLQKLQTACPEVPTSGHNKHFDQNYATLDDVTAAVVPLCHENGFVPTHTLGYKAMNFGMTLTLHHVKTGLTVESFVPIPESMLAKSQAVGSAITYYRRYTLAAMLELRLNDPDDDGAKSTHHNKQRTPQPKRAPGATKGQKAGLEFMQLQQRDGGDMFTNFVHSIDNSTDPLAMSRIEDEIRAMGDRMDKDQIKHLRLRFAETREALCQEQGMS